MQPWLFEPGNPSSAHGGPARDAVARARAAVVASCGAEYAVFTSSATEANNWVFQALANPPRGRKGHVLVGSFDHESVMAPALALRKKGLDVEFAPPKELAARVKAETCLVSCMLVNNVTGERYDSEIRAVHDALRPWLGGTTFLHVDASQALGKFEWSLDSIGACVLTLSAHKVGGPKGAGALCVRARAKSALSRMPLMLGGGQEGGLRSGTENVAAIAGMGAACSEAAKNAAGAPATFERQAAALRRELDAHKVAASLLLSAGHVMSVLVKYAPAEPYVRYLADRGVRVGAGSACSGLAKASAAVEALVGEQAKFVVRVSTSLETEDSDFAAFAEALAGAEKHFIATDVERAGETEPRERAKLGAASGGEPEQAKGAESKPKQAMSRAENIDSWWSEAGADAPAPANGVATGVANGVTNGAANGVAKKSDGAATNGEVQKRDGPPQEGGKAPRCVIPASMPLVPYTHDVAFRKAEFSTNVLILREGEMCLKSKRGAKLHKGSDMYTLFKRKLMTNLRIQLLRVNLRAKCESEGYGVITVTLASADDAPKAVQLCRQIHGIFSVSLALTLPRDLSVEELAAKALVLVPNTGTFRVSANRLDKKFPLSSPNLERALAELILPQRTGLKVDLHNAETVLSVDVKPDVFILDGARIPAIGGMPSETGSTAACLLSGGIDSPVAAWMTMRRGVRVVYVAFDSAPYTGPETVDKIVGLTRQLSQYQTRTALYVVPFADCQRAIVASAPQEIRTVLYRRLMAEIARRIARREDGRAIITGEAVGQVASQTLPNMATIGAKAGLVLRPLVGMDKITIIQAARRIGTFELSNVQVPDSCIVFAPKSPSLAATTEQCDAAEAEYSPPMGELLQTAMRATVVLQGQFLHVPGAYEALRKRSCFMGSVPAAVEAELDFDGPEPEHGYSMCEACGVRFEQSGKNAQAHFEGRRHKMNVALLRAIQSEGSVM